MNVALSPTCIHILYYLLCLGSQQLRRGRETENHSKIAVDPSSEVLQRICLLTWEVTFDGWYQSLCVCVWGGRWLMRAMSSKQPSK